MFAGVMIDLTRMDLEAETPGLPGTQDSAGQQQSSAVAGTPHKAGVPIAAIAGAAAGGLAALLIGMPSSDSPLCWLHLQSWLHEASALSPS